MYRRDIIASFLEYLILSVVFGFLSGLINEEVKNFRDWVKVVVTSIIAGLIVGLILKGLEYNDCIIWGAIVTCTSFALFIHRLIVKIFVLLIEQPIELLQKVINIFRKGG